MTLQEIQLAHWYGMARQIANEQSKDKPYYDRAAMVSDREAQPAAVLCEIAVAKWLGIYYLPTLWAAKHHKDNRQTDDVTVGIEVRRVRRPGTGPAVRSTDRGKLVVGVYLSDQPADDWTQPDILGWVAVARGATKQDFLEHYEECGSGEKKYFRCPLEKLIPPSRDAIKKLVDQTLDPLHKIG
jgi:hypothetical protein